MADLGGKFGLWGGNARSTDNYVRAKDQNAPPPVLYSDSSYILDVILGGNEEATLSGYHTGDVNMDGVVRAKPRIFPPPILHSDVTFILDQVLNGDPDLTRTQQ